MTIIKADQVNIVSDKVKLTKEQAEVIESLMKYHTRERIVRRFVESTSTHEKYEGFELGTLINALYNGYEVEQTVEEKLIEEYGTLNKSNYNEYKHSYRQGILVTLDIIGMKVKGINE